MNKQELISFLAKTGVAKYRDKEFTVEFYPQKLGPASFQDLEPEQQDDEMLRHIKKLANKEEDDLYHSV
jgi:hypothetical protein